MRASIGVLFAVVAMLLNSAAGMLQSEATTRTSRRHPLAVQPRYLGGLVVDGLGWGATVVALRLLPVFAVQAILGGAIAVTALASRFIWGTVLQRRERVGVTACLLGLVLVAAGAGGDGAPAAGLAADLVLGAALAVLVGVLLAMRNVRSAWPFALLAGLGFGGTSLAVAAVRTGGAADFGVIVVLLAQPATYLVVGFWLVGLTSYSRALGRGDLAGVTAVFTITEVVVPGIAGIALLGDRVRPGWGWIVVAGLLLAVAGVLELARSPTRRIPGPVAAKPRSGNGIA